MPSTFSKVPADRVLPGAGRSIAAGLGSALPEPSTLTLAADVAAPVQVDLGAFAPAQAGQLLDELALLLRKPAGQAHADGDDQVAPLVGRFQPRHPLAAQGKLAPVLRLGRDLELERIGLCR